MKYLLLGGTIRGQQAVVELNRAAASMGLAACLDDALMFTWLIDSYSLLGPGKKGAG